MSNLWTAGWQSSGLWSLVKIYLESVIWWYSTYKDDMLPSCILQYVGQLRCYICKRAWVPGVISIENFHIKIENTTCTSLWAWTLKHAFNWGREPACSTILHVNMYCETALSLKSLKGHLHKKFASVFFISKHISQSLDWYPKAVLKNKK